MTGTIGIVGVGRMGLAMAERLIQAGYKVTGYRRSAMDDFIAAGGIAAGSPAEVAASADHIITCLRGDASVAEVINGPDGLVSALKPGQIVIETTTLTPEQKRVHASRIAEVGAVMLDCPVSGTPDMLRAGRAAFFASGDRNALNRVNDPLMAIAPQLTWVGDIGAGAAVKSVATALVAIHNLAAAEGLAMAAREGGDLQAVHQAISGSPAGSAMFEMRGAMMAKRDYSSGGGSLEGYLKGLTEVADAAETGGPTPLLSVTRAVYSAAADAGYTDRDQASVFEFLMNGEI